MTFLTSIVLGLCMGSGAVISMQYGGGEETRMRQSVFQSFALIAGISLAVNLLVYLGLNGILWVLRVPVEIPADEAVPRYDLRRHFCHFFV